MALSFGFAWTPLMAAPTPTAQPLRCSGPGSSNASPPSLPHSLPAPALTPGSRRLPETQGCASLETLPAPRAGVTATARPCTPPRRLCSLPLRGPCGTHTWHPLSLPGPQPSVKAPPCRPRAGLCAEHLCRGLAESSQPPTSQTRTAGVTQWRV